MAACDIEEILKTVCEQGERLVEQRSNDVVDSLSFTNAIGSAGKSVRGFIKDKISSILNAEMGEFASSSLSGSPLALINQMLDSNIDHIMSPTTVKGSSDFIANSPADFIGEKIKDFTSKIRSTPLMGAITGGSKVRMTDINIGTFRKVQGIASEVVPDKQERFHQLMSMTSLVLTYEPESIYAFGKIAADQFILNNADRVVILNSLKKSVISLHDRAILVDSSWYDLDIFKRLDDSLFDLEQADSSLQIVRRKIGQDIFDNRIYEEARSEVKSAIDRLTDFDSAGVSAEIYEIMGLLQVYDLQIKRYSEIEGNIKDDKSNMETWRPDIREQNAFNGMFSAMIVNLQSKIRSVVVQMRNVKAQRKRALLISQMYNWAMQLRIIHSLMNVTGNVLSTFLDNDPTGDGALWDIASGDLSGVDLSDSDLLIFFLRRFHSTVSHNLNVDIPNSTITAQKNNIITRIDIELANSSTMNGIMSSIPDPVIAVASDVIRLATEFGFDRAADSISRGDWKSVFSMTPNTASYVGFLNNAVNAARGCFGEEGIDFQTEQKISDISNKLNQMEKQEELDNVSFERIRKDSITEDKFSVIDLQNIDATLNSIINDLSSSSGIDCS